MARRTFVHIGLPKTGTTYVQTTMWRNRPQLLQQGFLYPGDKRFDHYHAQDVIRGARPEQLGANADAWDRVRGALTSWDGDGLFSHEFLCMATADQISRVVTDLQPTEVHVVVTVRDHVRQFPALWQEALKMNYDDSFSTFVADALEGRRRGPWGMTSQDLPRILERWAGAVPPDRIHVITTPAPGAPRTLLWERWCRVLGIDDSDFAAEAGRANESLGASQAALLQRVKPHLTDDLTTGPGRHRWVRGYFGHEVLVPQRGERFGVRPEQASQLRQLSLETANFLGEHDFDVVGEIHELVPQEVADPMPHPEDVSLEEQLDVAARAINTMIHDVRRLTLRKEVLERRLRRRTPTSRLHRLRQSVRRRLGRG